MANELGGARTSTEAEIVDRDGIGKAGGVYLGHYREVKDGDLKKSIARGRIDYLGDRHLLLFGPTGSGKTKRFLVPNLLLGLEDRSVIVIDPKGELAAMTADHRKSLGHEVVILNPFNVLNLGSAGFNPMSVLDAESPNFYDDAAALADALIKIEGDEPHWAESAQGLMTGLLMWEKLQRGAAASLENVRFMLTEADEFDKERDANGEKRQRAGLGVTAKKMVAVGGEIIESLAGRFADQHTDEIASIRSNADTQTRWLLSSKMRPDILKDGIDFRTLKERPTTVYVVLPAERLRTHSVWLRLVIVSALRSLYRPGGLRTLMLIDEMAALGHLAPLEDAFGLVRGYRIQIAAILQDLPQLQELYKKRWETFVANAGVVFGFAPNDMTSAEWMSKRSGQTTVVVKGYSENTGTSTGQQTSTSAGSGASDQQMARPLFLSHELFGLESGMGMMWLAGLDHTTCMYMPYYLNIGLCEARAKPSPYDLN